MPMDAPAPAAPVKVCRWLPYWAVFQADVRQTLASWVYRIWVLVFVLVAVGYLLSRRGLAAEAGIVQPASLLVSDVLRWIIMGSVTLVIVLTAGSISSERGTMADSILSRGISRYQYFLGKLQARLFTVLGTFVALSLAALVSSTFLLHEDLSLMGSVVGLIVVVCLMTAVVTVGVSVSAMSSSTVMGITVVWIALYGTGFILMMLPESYPSPDRMLHRLPHVLRGYYDWSVVLRLVGWSLGGSLAVALVGLGYFSRRDV